MSIKPESLGSSEFKSDYGIRYAYVAGSMYKGISSKEMVVKMARAKLIGFLGTGGLSLSRIESDIKYIKKNISTGQSYGMNLLCNLIKPEIEEQTVELFQRYDINYVEAAAFTQMTSALVLFRLKGVHINADGNIQIPHFIIAKISRPEIAEVFLSPAPPSIVKKLVEQGKLTAEEARLGEYIPMSHDICVESDSGGHTDQRVALTMVPVIMRLRDKMMQQYHYPKSIRVGAAGGIGTPEAAAALFVMGVDFILTGSINQCTVEAGQSDLGKDMLQDMNVQDTAYVPAGDIFETGAKVQVLKKGLLFPARANKLYDLYSHYDSIAGIEEKTKKQIEEHYFKRSLESVWEETKAFYQKEQPVQIVKAENNPKRKMALIFRWYFIHTTRLALRGDTEQNTDYQIHTSSALGAFNQWVSGTQLENWRNRHVDEIAEKLMQDTAELLNKNLVKFNKTID